MKKLLACVATVSILLAGAAACGRQEPLGTRLQKAAGSGYEVIYDPTTRIYTVEPK
jgi:hypothetical protein